MNTERATHGVAPTGSWIILQKVLVPSCDWWTDVHGSERASLDWSDWNSCPFVYAVWHGRKVWSISIDGDAAGAEVEVFLRSVGSIYSP